MAGLSDFVQKAMYLGIGLASYAGEKAGSKLTELKSQVQKLADEMVERGELTAEEARRFVDDAMHQANQTGTAVSSGQKQPSPQAPREIPISFDEESPNSPANPTDVSSSPSSGDEDVEALRQKMLDLKEELRKLKQP